MALRAATGEGRTGLRRARLTARGGVATLTMLLGSGLLAAVALGSSHSARAQSPGSTITSTTTVTTTGDSGPSALPVGAWMTFEANPVSFVLRPVRQFAACARKHGIPRLPDPNVVDGKVVLLLPPGRPSKSPTLKKAQRACEKLLPQGPSTQPGTGTGPTTTRPGSH